MTVFPACHLGFAPHRTRPRGVARPEGFAIAGSSGAKMDGLTPLTTKIVGLTLSAAMLILSGCASTMPQTVQVPVAVKCAPADSPTVPAITAKTDLLKLDDRGLVLRIAAERLDLIDYAGKADAVISACR